MTSQATPTMPDPAPSTDTLAQISDRLALWSSRGYLPRDETSEQYEALLERAIHLDGPSRAEWLAVDEQLAYAYARALADARAYARAYAYAYARALADARAYARARAYAYARALADARARALVALLGDRIAPVPRLDAAILEHVEVIRDFALEMGTYHGSNACGTTHCRAGSAIVLHPLGAELEAVFGSWLAGAAIYLCSTGRVPDFFATNKAALQDIRDCAARKVQEDKS